jgi:pimeloyl-ACP methyl ester carboxylesterase
MSVTDDAARRPSLHWFLTEPVRGAMTFGTLPFAVPLLSRAPRGDGHGVLLLPGLMADDLSNQALRAYLTSLGYVTRGWGLGRNIGPTDAVLDGMPVLLQDMAAATGGPVSLVGWSLGGIYARELARDHPHLVRQVITLGSPFALVDPRQSRAEPAFRRRSRRHAHSDRVPGRDQLSRPIPVPSTAIYSRSDGIVHWRACMQEPAADRENIEVACAHLGFGVDPATLWAVADRLAQRRGQWRPFRPAGWARAFYPVAR